jgi:putative flippase GtrA
VAEERPKKRHDIKRVGKFGLVGILNTLIDFVIFNLLSGPPVGLGLIQSNIISTTVAMMFSFITNKKLVFQKHDGSAVKQALMFYAVTAFGLYILQTGTIHILTEVWTWPTQLAVSFANAVGFSGHDQFVAKNFAKAAGTVFSLSWNYIMYKKVVFK